MAVKGELAGDQQKKRDWWDRASILSGFLSSVVIATLGLLLTSRFQMQQDATTRAINDAQRKSAETIVELQQKTATSIAESQTRSSQDIAALQQATARAIADAQVAAGKTAQEAQQRLQESRFTADLFQYILDKDPNRRIFGISVLRRSVAQTLYEDVLDQVATGDEDARVRVIALRLLGRSGNPAVTPVLGRVAVDATRSQAERQEAISSIVALDANARAQICAEGLESALECHKRYPSGCSSSGKYDPYLNLLKNQMPTPTTKSVRVLNLADFVGLESRVPSGLGIGNRVSYLDSLTSLGEGQIVEVVGYLYAARAGGRISANCQLPDVNDTTWTLSVGFEANLTDRLGGGLAFRQQTIVAAMTPHVRAQFHSEWTLEKLLSVLNRQVRIKGQLILNTEHMRPRDDCGAPNANHETCWRASAWEIHPVIELMVCSSADPCTAESSDWRTLEESKSLSGEAKE